MKGKIVSEMAYASTLDFAHGIGETVKRLIVEKDAVTYVAITPYDGHVWVVPGFHFSKEVKVLGEVEVPDELVKRMMDAAEVQKNLFEQLKVIVEAEQG